MTVEQIKEFKEALHNGIVEFKYTKVNGDERTAKGTLKQEDIESNGGSMPKGVMEVSDETIRYYDINSEGWRSFRTENFVSIL